ncbi:GNAT family N-acetyltransferase [Pseudoduganella namucuonensis]|uniref:FR47-like protein n=1 Tax=Pseudoduganella namucuonensis TaxID=1035707 RepID=A0A1I7M5M3_9BURK|nr:GNAT family N-acetyltransferase [Pseudoduganella namucuonensis]SFV17241.1 FR47-like protein [Pseudoduganella namucuonensis]
MTELDNPIWSALTSAHSGMARLNGLAARYPREVSPLAGLREPTARALADLRAMAEPNEELWLLSDGPLDLPAGWKPLRARHIDQMVSTEPRPVAPDAQLLVLGPVDVPEMAALVELTKPGPFQPRTIEMGRYLGVRGADGGLAAMCGQRMNLERHREISAVCTHPDARGAGHSRKLMLALMARIRAEGKTPFLHVKTENGAKIVYEKLGFQVRREIYFSVIAAV